MDFGEYYYILILLVTYFGINFQIYAGHVDPFVREFVSNLNIQLIYKKKFESDCITNVVLSILLKRNFLRKTVFDLKNIQSYYHTQFDIEKYRAQYIKMKKAMG